MKRRSLLASGALSFLLDVKAALLQLFTLEAYVAGALLGLMLLIYFVARWRVRREEVRARRLEHRVALRTAEVQLQKTQLEAQNERLARQKDQLADQAWHLRVVNDELKCTVEALREADEARGKLMSMAAHDLKNPLVGIRGLAQVLLEGAGDHAGGAEKLEKLALIRSATQQMLETVQDLLESVAAKKGKVVLNERSVSLPSLVDWVLMSVHPQAGAKRQILRFVRPSDPCVVEGDQGRLREVVTNLLSNAVKYSPKGSLIEVRLQREKDTVRLAVEDEGPGLTEDDKQRLFEPFQRLSAQPTGGEPSSGLGLYIVRRLVELHGGRVWAESTPGTGSTFFVALPVGAGDELREEAETPTSSRAASSDGHAQEMSMMADEHDG